MGAAADVYEIVVSDIASPTSWWQDLLRRVRRAGPVVNGGVIISVLDRESGDELFRHIEDGGDDDDHLLYGIKQDLASMTADEFRVTWG